VWFDFPQIKMSNGKWTVEFPASHGISESAIHFSSLDEVFGEARDQTDLCSQYQAYIKAQLTSLRDQGRKIGALILEPIILGAGGMMFA
jgi:bifunctional dethiobiotin synthetase / adenosylmethionine---8-amino-7-oxononanoate aminotransferase